MYPFKFKPIYFDKIWGGKDLKSFRDDMPEGDIGESWDAACHKNGTSIISNGEESIRKGDNILIPAALGEYEFVGVMKVLKSWVPGANEKK